MVSTMIGRSGYAFRNICTFMNIIYLDEQICTPKTKNMNEQHPRIILLLQSYVLLNLKTQPAHPYPFNKEIGIP